MVLSFFLKFLPSPSMKNALYAFIHYLGNQRGRSVPIEDLADPSPRKKDGAGIWS